jgi:hypothetical protein
MAVEGINNDIELAAEMIEHYTEHYLVKSSSQANSPHPSQQIQHANGHPI